MKRIVLTGAAVAGLFTAGAGVSASVASAAKPKMKTKTVTTHQKVTKDVKIHAACKLTLSLAAPAGSTDVLAGAATGVNYGTTRCSGFPNAKGASMMSYTTDASGDLTGTVQQWFKAGTIYGSFTLMPASSSGPPTATSFGAASYAGTFKVTGAGGQLKGATGTGKMMCSTNDSVHFNCTSKLSLTQPVTTIVTVTKKEKVA